LGRIKQVYPADTGLAGDKVLPELPAVCSDGGDHPDAGYNGFSFLHGFN
jgi:hypothetical protein